MMDINEAIMEEENLDKVKADILNFQDSIYEPVKPIVENYKDGITTTDELLMIKEYYYKKKYLLRLEQQLAGIP
jgi:molecular chaperone HscB